LDKRIQFPFSIASLILFVAAFSYPLDNGIVVNLPSPPILLKWVTEYLANLAVGSDPGDKMKITGTYG